MKEFIKDFGFRHRKISENTIEYRGFGNVDYQLSIAKKILESREVPHEIERVAALKGFKITFK